MRRSELPCQEHSTRVECVLHVSVIGIRAAFLSAADHWYGALDCARENVTKLSKSLAMMGPK